LTDADPQNAPPEPAANGRFSKQTDFVREHRPWFVIGGPALIVLIAAYVIFFGGRFVSTDNAYVRAARVAVSASVPGRVVAVAVHENQAVKKGDVLVELDPVDLGAASQAAKAQLANARMQVEQLRAGYLQSAADLQKARDTAAFAQREQQRQEDLMNVGVSSKQDYDRAVHAADDARAQARAALQVLIAAQAALGGNPRIATDQHPTVLAAKAAADRAGNDLGHTKILAAADGVVTKVDQLEVGAYINTAQPLFWLVSGTPWIEANFKEDQLGKLKPGEQTEIKIDAYPGKKLKGRVASFSPGTGSSFALLPAENATGNWIKVSQRLPVQIELTEVPEGVFLASGLSASVKVDSKSEPKAPQSPKVADATP
jgi:membrane fusion protein (multidrug efflux system)